METSSGCGKGNIWPMHCETRGKKAAKTKSEMVLLLREEHVVDATAVEVGGVLGEEAVSM